MSDRPLHVIQLGAEGDATPGTAVPATRIIAGGTLDMSAVDEVYRPQHPVGLYVLNPTAPVVLLRGVDMTLDGDLGVDEIIDILAMGVKEHGAAVGMGPYVYTFDPSESSANDPRSYTFERRLSDGTAGGGDPWDVECAFVHARSFTITQNLNESAKMRAELFARRVQSSTLTPALSVLDPTFLTSGAWAVSIDDEGTAMGTTPLTGQVRSFEFTYQTGLFPKYFLDGRADRDFSSVGTGPRGVESLRLQLEWGAGAHAERAKAASQALRLIQLVGTRGTEIVQFDMVMRHAMGDFLTVQDADGNDVVDLEFVAAHDASPEAGDPAHFQAIITSDDRSAM